MEEGDEVGVSFPDESSFSSEEDDLDEDDEEEEEGERLSRGLGGRVFGMMENSVAAEMEDRVRPIMIGSHRCHHV